jgi:hypothetical protein
LAQEDETFYKSALTWLANQLTNKPKVLVTDRELALMNAIADVFPGAVNLVCRWHIHKNVLAKTSHLFSDKAVRDDFMKLWSQLVESKIPEFFNDNLRSIRVRFGDYPAALDYIDRWLRFKVHFVDCYINNVTHFGQVNSSRIEGAHASYKSFLGTARGGLFHATKSFLDNNDLKLRAIALRMSDARTKVIVFRPAVLELVRGDIPLLESVR